MADAVRPKHQRKIHLSRGHAGACARQYHHGTGAENAGPLAAVVEQYYRQLQQAVAKFKATVSVSLQSRGPQIGSRVVKPGEPT